ncbi:MAG TPA: HK97 family phage prohead protease [Nocardioidaceae bacterium]|nr:HK97 family phage prohead protease [Nocardioidaceae bacterium]
MQDEFPGVTFIALDGVKSIAVQRVEPTSVEFSDDDPGSVRVGFVLDEATSQFAADAERRVISGLVIPWNQVAYSGGAYWTFKPGALHWSSESRVKLDRDHVPGTEFGRATQLASNEQGLHGTFKVANTSQGATALELAKEHVYDGMSATVTFESQADGWTAHPDNPDLRVVHSATLRKVALTAMPAYDDARVAAVAARWAGEAPSAPPADSTTPPGDPAAERGVPVTSPSPAAGLALAAAPLDNPQAAPAAPAAAPQQPAAAPQLDAATFTAGLETSVRAAVEAAFANLPQPQAVRQVIPAGQVAQVREAPVYLMNGHGPSLVRDSWKARTEHDHEAGARLRKFAEQTRDQATAAMHPEFSAQFGVNTGNASQIIAPGYRPDLYVTQLLKGRPLTSGVSRGTLSDATPFNIPSFVSASGATGSHVEGVNPTTGSLTLGTVTVAPGAISGVFELSREIVDSANPAVDAIAMNAMHESYSQQTEAQVYAELNGTNGVGGTITSGFVPSGAQARLTNGLNGTGATGTATEKDLVAGIRAQLALYPFRRFGAPDRMYLSQEGTSALASAVGSDGRPLLPSVGAANTVGVGNAVQGGWYIDGLTAVPAWSMTGNAITDADVLIFNSSDVWAWESPLLMFRFEERGGPARIDLALFGYFATRILRPVGFSAVRFSTVAVP